jgi:hypothetical protein
MTAHARLFPPSGLDRAMVCTASVPLIDQLLRAGEITAADLEGDNEQISEDDVIDFGAGAYDDVVLDSRESTSFSAEGTVLHEVRQLCLELNLEPHMFVGHTFSADGFSFTIDEDMADRLVEGIDWIRQHTSTPMVEIRVDLSPWLPGQFGTCDTAWIYKNKLYGSDFKNGVGKPVSAIDNRQLRAYMLGVWHMLGRPDVKGVVINIDQPRAGGMKFWEITLDELLAFGEELREAYARVERGDVEFVPTKAGCQWCPVRKTKRGCAARNMWSVQMLGAGLMDPNEPPTFRDPGQMSRALRYYIVKHAPDIRAWLAQLHQASLDAAMAGDPDPGSKAIMGNQGHRYFTDQEAAAKLVTQALGDGAYKPRQLIGITEIDKLMKPGRKKLGHPEEYEALQELVSRPPGRPKLVPADHPGEPYNKFDDDDFDDA